MMGAGPDMPGLASQVWEQRGSAGQGLLMRLRPKSWAGTCPTLCSSWGQDWLWYRGQMEPMGVGPLPCREEVDPQTQRS